MAEQESSNDNQPKPFVLRRRNRVPVEIAQGRFFARHIVTGDLPVFNKYLKENTSGAETDYNELGKLGILRLVCIDETGDCVPALTEESFSSLTEADVAALAKAVGQACELTSSANISSLPILGSALAKYLSALAKQLNKSSEAIRQSVGANFANLSATVQAALGERFSALSAARNALGTSTAVEAAQLAHERLNSFVGQAIAGAPRVGDAITPPSRPLVVDIEPFRPPKFEETAAGRTAARAASASEESAKQLSEVAGLMGTMAEQMAALQTVFLSEVLPQWFQNLEDGADATRTTLRQAESSLFWAKWALVASVVVSIVMTGWQVWLAREYKLENDKQQENTELLLRQQLKEAHDLNSQLKKLSEPRIEGRQPVNALGEKGKNVARERTP